MSISLLPKGRAKRFSDLIQQHHPAEFFASGKTDDFRRGHGLCWGAWELNAPSRTLQHKRTSYIVPLDECVTAHGALDWLCQIGSKVNYSDSEKCDLQRALMDILRPQANLRGPEPWEPEWAEN